jgi:hypothetical protein
VISIWTLVCYHTCFPKSILLCLTVIYQATRPVRRQTAQLGSVVGLTIIIHCTLMALPSPHQDSELYDGTLPPYSSRSPHRRTSVYSSDTPYALALASLQAIPVLTGADKSPFNFSIYTGDLVSHDPDNQLSRYVSFLNHTLFLFFHVLHIGIMLCIQRFVAIFESLKPSRNM